MIKLGIQSVFVSLISVAFISACHVPLINFEEAFKDLSLKCSSLPLVDIHHFNPFDREKWVKEKAQLLKSGSKVLDVGAGESPYRSHFGHCIYKTHDFAENKNHVNYTSLDYVSDIKSIPVSDNEFDAIICTEVLEHVPYPIEALKEMARILKPGGKLLLTAPLGSGLHQMPYHFYGGYTPEWYRFFCDKFDLEIIEIIENGGTFKLLAQESARVAWSFDKHKEHHGKSAEFVYWLFNDFMPRYLFELDNKCFMPEFTIGYNVEAVKKLK
ncbi:class I SAM-dependent methyltransferase [Candidatus Dependentiae bacterium]|nr:class I SAM-dependent methyltransferase [Candidatus Dependentiae bacterium]